MKLNVITLLLFSATANAAQFSPDTFLDEVDAKVGDGICLTAEGHCSLRAAIQESNFDSQSAHEITLKEGKYLISLGQYGENDSEIGDFDIKSEIYINGAGQDKTSIDAQGRDRHFDIHPSAQTSKLSISNLSLINGTSFEDAGGSIRNLSILDADNISFSGNKNDNSDLVGNGGAIYIGANSNATITNSTFKTNNAHNGGAIFNEGNANSLNNTYEENTSQFGGSIYNNKSLITIADNLSNDTAVDGGSIYNAAKIAIDDATIENSIASNGGALFNKKSGEARITNSTLNLNSAEDGGGIFNDGELFISESILSSNKASSNGGAIQNNGSYTMEMVTGIANEAQTTGGFNFNTGTASIINSTLLNNKANTNGGASFNSLGETKLEFVSLANNEADSSNTIYTLEGTTNIHGSYIQANAGATVCKQASKGDRNVSLGYNIFSTATCELEDTDIIASEAYTTKKAGKHQLIVTPSNSSAINHFDGSKKDNPCPALSINGSVRNITNCDAGSYDHNSEIADKGTISLINQKISINEASPNPSNTDTQVISIPVQRQHGSDGEISIFYQTTGLSTSTNTSDADYTDRNGVLLWKNGDSETKNIEVNIKDDELVEQDEQFSIQLASGSTKVGTSKQIITIMDNDQRKGTFSLEHVNPTITEGTPITFKVFRDEYAVGAIDIELIIKDLTEIDALEVILNKTVHFEDGQREATVSVNIADNDKYRPSATFSIAIEENKNIRIGATNQIDLTVADDELAPTFGIFTVQKISDSIEGLENTIQISRSSQTGSIEGTVKVLVESDDAQIFFENETISFGPNDMNGSIKFIALDNNKYSPPKDANLTFTIVSSEDASPFATEASITPTMPLKIIDNDLAPSAGSFSLSVNTVTFKNEGEFAEISILRNEGYDGQYSFNLEVIPGTADASDIQLTPTSITFEDGQKVASFKILAVKDQTFEEMTETLTIKLTSNTEGILITNPSLKVSLNDGEPSTNVLESDGGALNFTIFGLLTLLASLFDRRRVMNNRFSGIKTPR